MSRSRKKAIIKDKYGSRNQIKGCELYRRVIRRTNKSFLKHYYKSSAKISPHRGNYNENEEFLKFYNYFLNMGYHKDVAHSEASYLTEDDLSFSRIVGNLYKDWWDEPEMKSSKTLINDCNYNHYTSKIEFYHRNSWNHKIGDKNCETLENLKNKYRRK